MPKAQSLPIFESGETVYYIVFIIILETAKIIIITNCQVTKYQWRISKIFLRKFNQFSSKLKLIFIKLTSLNKIGCASAVMHLTKEKVN